jgi:hypothetical protein
MLNDHFVWFSVAMHQIWSFMLAVGVWGSGRDVHSVIEVVTLIDWCLSSYPWGPNMLHNSILEDIRGIFFGEETKYMERGTLFDHEMRWDKENVFSKKRKNTTWRFWSTALWLLKTQMEVNAELRSNNGHPIIKMACGLHLWPLQWVTGFVGLPSTNQPTENPSANRPVGPYRPTLCQLIVPLFFFFENWKYNFFCGIWRLKEK